MAKRPDDEQKIGGLGELVRSLDKLADTSTAAVEKFDRNTELIRAVLNDLITGDLRIVIQFSTFPFRVFIYLDQRNKKNDPRVHKNAA